MSDLQLNRLKSKIKNGIGKTLNLSSIVIRFCKAFANNSSAKIKLSKTHLFKKGESGGFLGRLLGPLLKHCLPLMNNVLKSLITSSLIPLGIATKTSETDATIQKNFFALEMTTLIISNEEMNDIMKIMKYLEYASLLIIAVSEAMEN